MNETWKKAVALEWVEFLQDQFLEEIGSNVIHSAVELEGVTGEDA